MKMGMSIDGMILKGENQNTQRKTCPNATWCTTHLTRADLGSNPWLCSERSADLGTDHKSLSKHQSVLCLLLVSCTQQESRVKNRIVYGFKPFQAQCT